MKCRRSKASRGARLRAAAEAQARAATRKHTAGPSSPVDSAGTSKPAPEAPPGVLRIDGTTQGDIQYAGVVVIGRQGAVTGDITATLITVEGQVEGDLHATHAVRLAATARVIGNLRAPRVAVARGAGLRGRITTQPGISAGRELEDSEVADLLAGA
jgi:hypothetical protein